VTARDREPRLRVSGSLLGAGKEFLESTKGRNCHGENGQMSQKVIKHVWKYF